MGSTNPRRRYAENAKAFAECRELGVLFVGVHSQLYERLLDMTVTRASVIRAIARVRGFDEGVVLANAILDELFRAPVPASANWAMPSSSCCFTHVDGTPPGSMQRRVNR